MDVDSVPPFVRISKFCVIHGFGGFSHLFYADAFAVLVGLPVPLIFYFFGMHAFTVGFTCAEVTVGVNRWLLGRRIVRPAIPHSEGCWVL